MNVMVDVLLSICNK